jgi:demethylmenaquinone methyltransferase/2-methoxy-6-polyprenyl-1,4-benzoquinol methylase
MDPERTRHARRLFAGIAPEYDRMGSVLSFGQEPRWRRFLVSKVNAIPGSWVLDVATGTGLVARELARKNVRVVGLDQSPDMVSRGLDAVRERGLDRRVRFALGQAQALPFRDGAFDAVTFTYLLRYVDDPSATMRELARVVRPGGVVAMLEFFEPQAAVPHIAWEAYVRAGLPVLGRLASPGWGEVGRFLGPSIRDFWQATPPDRLRAVWNEAGIRNVQARLLSLGGGIVMWGRRGD